MLSDGEDTSSLLPFEEVLDLAKRSETAIYAIGLRVDRRPGRRRKGFKEAEFVLRQFAQETGGRAFFPNQISELAEHLRPDLRRAVEPVHGRLHVAQRDAATASWRRVVVRVEPAEPDGAHQAGILRADVTPS